MKKKRRIITCVCGCDQSGENAGREMIGPCYQRWYTQAVAAGEPIPARTGPTDTTHMAAARSAQRAERVRRYTELARTNTNPKALASRLGVSIRTINTYAAEIGPVREVPDMAEMVARRKAHGIAQKDMATALGLSPAAVNTQEKPGKRARLSTLYAYQDALNALIAEQELTSQAG